MAAFDLERGAREWTADVTSTQTPWVAGNFLFVLTERGEVVCLVDQGGRIRWVSPLGSRVDPENPDSRRSAGLARFWQRSAAARELRRRTGERLALDRRDARLARDWRGPCPVPAAVADGTVYFLTDAPSWSPPVSVTLPTVAILGRPERRQVDPVQPAGRPSAGDRRRHPRASPATGSRASAAWARRVSRHRHGRARGRRRPRASPAGCASRRCRAWPRPTSGCS